MNNMQCTTENRSLTSERLVEQNQVYRKTGGVSSCNHSLDFVPAFRDMETGSVYRSCFADGKPAPFHMLEGLPNRLFLSINTDKKHASIVIKNSVIDGFLRDGLFYSREEAAQAVAGNKLQ